MRELRKVITKAPQKENETDRNIINTFFFNMKKEFFPGLVRNGTYKQAPGTYFPMMLKYNNGHYDSFIAIGEEAEILKDYGKDIGVQKKISKAVLDNTGSFEVEDAQKGFGWKFHQLINTKTKRTKDENGNPITLIINMAHNRKYGRTNFKSWVGSIEFRPASENITPKAPATTPASKPAIVKKSGKKTKFSDTAQLSLF